MSEPMWDEKGMLRATKYMEALQAEIESTLVACWRLELRHPELYPALDDDGPPEDGPPAWRPSELN